MKKIFIIILFSLSAFAQKQGVNWLSFEEMETALTAKPKKVMIHFYADWCTYCKKMEKAVYTKPKVVEVLNLDYYAVKFNVESTDTIRFGGKTFVNRNISKKRTAFHQIPELLAGREHKNLELPATVILNEDFTIKARYYHYIAPKEMLSILKDN